MVLPHLYLTTAVEDRSGMLIGINDRSIRELLDFPLQREGMLSRFSLSGNLVKKTLRLGGLCERPVCVCLPRCSLEAKAGLRQSAAKQFFAFSFELLWPSASNIGKMTEGVYFNIVNYVPKVVAIFTFLTASLFPVANF